MAPLFLILALIIQSSFINASIDNEDIENISREILDQPPEDADIKEFRAVDTDWLDLFTLPKGDLHPSSAAAKMALVTNSDKSADEQLEEMKEVARQITLAIQSEMANLLSYALRECDKETEENNLRKRRSVETPMDSSQLVMRLLRHIKTNNEYQNIAIEKMMSAQEIADKFGIDYQPDPDIFSDFAFASNKQAEELASILKDASEMKNVTKEIEFIPINEEPVVNSTENDTYYSYTVHPEDIAAHLNTAPSHEFMTDYVHETRVPVAHIHYEQHPHHNYHYNYPYETQVVPPPHHYHRNPPVSAMPAFFEPMAFTPVPDHYPAYYPEPITTTTTIVLPFDEPAELEPELVGEEFEETVSSKVVVDRGDEPGSATVNHVMTYTLSEKSHFKKPQLESLPQQMQYYFFLM